MRDEGGGHCVCVCVCVCITLWGVGIVIYLRSRWWWSWMGSREFFFLKIKKLITLKTVGGLGKD